MYMALLMRMGSWQSLEPRDVLQELVGAFNVALLGAFVRSMRATVLLMPYAQQPALYEQIVTWEDSQLLRAGRSDMLA